MDRFDSDAEALQLTQHGAALYALGRSLLRDDAAAEDLVQDTYVAALDRRPEQRAGLLPWLTAVASRLARRDRRTRQRRAEREATAARPERVESTGDVAAETDLFRRIAVAVHELDEPFRTAVHLRYWQGLSPSEIADATEVPLNTVRSRLQRGLAKLRGRFDAEDGDRRAWAAPLAVMLETRPAAPAAAILTGVLLMKSKWVIGSAAAAAVALGLWISRPSGAEPPDGSVASVPPPVGAALRSEPRARDVVPVDRAPAAMVSASSGVTFRGRCVDAVTGDPVAGCTVRVRALRERRWHHVDEAGYRAPVPVDSGPDGRFSITAQPAAERLELSVVAGDAAVMSAWWNELDDGADLDVGDVVIQRGCAVFGRVADTDGIPREGALVAVSASLVGAVRNREKIAPTGQFYVTSRADGTFELPGSVAPGRWSLSVASPHYPATPNGGVYELEIAEGQTREFVDVVVLRHRSSIEGVVLDETGAPVAGAGVHLRDPSVQVYCDADGRFRLPEVEGRAGGNALLVSGEGFDTVILERPAWGTDDFEVVLPRCRELVLLVVDADSGEPITDYSVGIAGDRRGDTRFTIDEVTLEYGGHHPGGRLRLPIKAGPHVLIVEPVSDEWSPSEIIGIAMETLPVPTLRVELRRCVQRMLRVVDAGGEPVSGTEVELLRSFTDSPIAMETPTWDVPDVLGAVTVDGVVRMQRGATSPRGELTLSAPPGRDYAVRLLGPGHVPQLVADVELGEGLGPLEVVVGGGASVVGRVGPAKSLAALQPDDGMRELMAAVSDVAQKHSARLFPHVWLARDDGARFPEDNSVVIVAEDGAFRIDSVPPGDWAVHFGYSLTREGGSIQRSAAVRTVRDLVEGEVRSVELDIGGLLPGRLRGRVFVEGEPVARKRISVLRRGAPGEVALPTAVTTDADGRFDVEVAPGRYLVMVPVSSGGNEETMYSPASAEVPPAAAIDHVFELFVQRLKVRILGVDGAPVVGRSFTISGPRYWKPAGETDENGELVIDPVPLLGAFHLATWPDELADQAAQLAHIRANPYPKWLDALIQLGPIEVPPGQREHTVELRLPW